MLRKPEWGTKAKVETCDSPGFQQCVLAAFPEIFKTFPNAEVL
jgi:hypothetical protein